MQTKSLEYWPEQRIAWLALFFTTLCLELGALYFQYGMQLEPCVKCIYQRLAIFGVTLAAILPIIYPKFWLARFVGFSTWLISAGWGYKVASGHLAVQNAPNPLFAVCDTIPDFPEWFNPHVWVPSLFEPRGQCGEIDWQFLGLSMPGWMQMLFAAYFISGALILTYRLFKLRKV